MITVAHLLGVAQPPGYSGHTMLAKLASCDSLRHGGLASLFSALIGSASTLLLCRAVIRWTGDVAAGALAAGALAFGPLVWPYAITARPYALNNLFAAGLRVLLRERRSRSTRRRFGRARHVESVGPFRSPPRDETRATV